MLARILYGANVVNLRNDEKGYRALMASCFKNVFLQESFTL
jgi:hypothetical protein